VSTFLLGGDTSRPPNPEEFETPFVWPLSFDLSDMVEPASSYAAVSIALRFKQRTQPLRHEMVASQGGIRENSVL